MTSTQDTSMNDSHASYAEAGSSTWKDLWHNVRTYGALTPSAHKTRKSNESVSTAASTDAMMIMDEESPLLHKPETSHESSSRPVIVVLDQQPETCSNEATHPLVVGQVVEESSMSDMEDDHLEKGITGKHSKRLQHQTCSGVCTLEDSRFTQWTVSETTVDSIDPLLNSMDESSAGQNCCALGRGMIAPGWDAYNKSLDDRPVITKACTSFCGWFIGDFVTQTVITGGPFNIRRSITLSMFGFCFHGPVGHVVYDGMDHIIVGTGPKEIMTKVLLDQAIWCPIFMVCYFTYLGLAHGDPPSAIIAKLHADMWTAVLASWKLWPLAHAIQFRYVATKHRIIYINCIEVCFIMFLSFLGNS